jgi:hypothetical protein
MQISAPYGYGDITPLERHHKVLLPNLAPAGGGAVPAFAVATNAMGLSFSEFAVASRDYPIVFGTVDGGASYAPLAVLGLADRQNLFVDAKGNWQQDTYVPAFVRRYPFCLSVVHVDGVAQKDRVICIERSYLDASGVALYDGGGKATPRWAERERMLAGYENDLELTAQMCAGLKKLDLFAPFTLEVTVGAKSHFKLQGMVRIDEQKFIALKPASHKALAAKGWAARVYAHLFSLANFARLYDRSVAVAGQRKARERAGG